MDAVPRERQGVSAGMFAVFGSIGTAFATAILTAIVVRHPFQVVAASPKGGHIVKNIPQVYTSAGWGQVYLLVGVVGSLIALLLTLWLKSGARPPGAANTPDSAPSLHLMRPAGLPGHG
jgi:MFS family permease